MIVHTVGGDENIFILQTKQTVFEIVSLLGEFPEPVAVR